MKQVFGMSERGDLKEAVRNMKEPSLLLLMSNEDQFEGHVEQLEAAFPGVPSIGCINMSYGARVVEKGVGVIAYTEGVAAAAGLLEEVSSVPVKYIHRLQKDLDKIGAASHNTVCINFCTGNDACVVTTMYSVLGARKIPMMGGTGYAGKVSVNGKVYEDAAAYALVKNQSGRVRVYKENIYQPCDDYQLIASKTDKSDYVIGELNGRPAKQVYKELLRIGDGDVAEQALRHPFGKINGKDMCIISVKEPVGNALACYRPVNDSDVLTILEARDSERIVEETVARIKGDFPRISAVLSVNCILRYLFFTQNGKMQKYLDTMEMLGNHAGMVGYGEHFNDQFLNQTMTCAVFE